MTGHEATTRSALLANAVDETAFVRETRNRVRAAISAPDRRSGLLTGGSFVLAMGAWLALAPPTMLPLAAFIACVIAHVMASSVEFEIGPGSALPTTPVLVVSLFILPAVMVPLVAVAGLIGAALVARARDPGRRERFFVLVGSGWHAIGLAAVFAISGVVAPEVGVWPVLVAALAAQFLFDAASAWVRNCYGLGVPTARLAGALRFTFLADLLLVPIGLAAAIVFPGSAAALLILVPPTLLLAMLQRDRRHQIDRALALGEAVAEASDRARRDALTGLPNRLAWEEAVARCVDLSTPIAVVLADVDGLKLANDTFGHDVGDELLVAVGRVLAAVRPDGDAAVAARLGGDEFGILLMGDTAALADSVAEALRVGLSQAGPVGTGVAVSASVGVGVADTAVGFPAAFLEADRAVCEDKRSRGVGRR